MKDVLRMSRNSLLLSFVVVMTFFSSFALSVRELVQNVDSATHKPIAVAAWPFLKLTQSNCEYLYEEVDGIRRYNVRLKLLGWKGACKMDVIYTIKESCLLKGFTIPRSVGPWVDAEDICRLFELSMARTPSKEGDKVASLESNNPEDLECILQGLKCVQPTLQRPKSCVSLSSWACSRPSYGDYGYD